MKHVLITGANGLLGRACESAFTQAGWTVSALSRSQLDVSDPESVSRAIPDIRPNLVIHCAAMTDVDMCEGDPVRARLINEGGSRAVAQACEVAGADLVAVSTDYVFAGDADVPYSESDPTGPIQAYGRTKLAGEHAVVASTPRHYVVRSAWIYGAGGKNFISRLPEFVAASSPISAVTDQTGSPTFAPDLAKAFVTLVETGAYGTYHLSNRGACSFAELCRHVLSAMGAEATVSNVSWTELGRPAVRPVYTALDNAAWRSLGLEPLRDWTEAAADFAVARS